jgi:septum site-determining protein MinD
MQSNYTLTVAGSKGGVGKTTTSINLGACFADAGYETVVVEVDLAMANLVDFISLEMDPRRDETLHDVLADGLPVVDAVYDIGDCLSVVPSGTDVERYSEVDVGELEQVLDHLWWHFDVIVLDTPAGVGQELTEPARLADETLLVSTPRVSSVRNTRNARTVVEHTGTDVRGLVLTKSGTGASPGAHRIAEFLELELLGHVPNDDAIPHSQDRGQPVVEYAPRSGAALAYRKIAAQLVESIDIDAEGPVQPNRGSDETGTTHGSDFEGPGPGTSDPRGTAESTAPGASGLSERDSETRVTDPTDDGGDVPLYRGGTDTSTLDDPGGAGVDGRSAGPAKTDGTDGATERTEREPAVSAADRESDGEDVTGKESGVSTGADSGSHESEESDTESLVGQFRSALGL